MPAYYSEFDPKAAAWLRELIKQGHIADGEVDERDLWDVRPSDLRGFTQVHLCAGIGVWSYALRRAGWGDDRSVWTGSFPCQPFSSAGKGAGFADERHLWPAGFRLIDQCRPRTLFGEQVASKDAEPWLDLVQADLEGLGYAFGACAFPSAGIGAPHIRDRTYWVADINGAVAEQPARGWARPDQTSGARAFGEPERRGDAGRLADACGMRLAFGSIANDGRGALRLERAPVAEGELSGGMAFADSAGRQPGRWNDQAPGHGHPAAAARGDDRSRESGPVNGLWRDADWLFCRDGKWRPVEPGAFPLAHGAPARVGRLRGYGNAINAEAAIAWIESYLDTQTIEA